MNDPRALELIDLSRIAERKLFSLRALLREDSTRYEQIADREAKTNCELL